MKRIVENMIAFPKKYRVLDLFCGAGGAAMGYHRAGFEVIGVDIRPQPHYPFEFFQADALAFPLDGYDAIHASPPCQKYSIMNNIHKAQNRHPDYIADIRERLLKISKPYIIENVWKSPLKTHLMLCGTMFGLKIICHRYFECSFPTPILTTCCNHQDIFDPWHGDGRTANKFREAMGIDWMPMGGGRHREGTIGEAIPPPYTEWIGKHLIKYLDSR